MAARARLLLGIPYCVAVDLDREGVAGSGFTAAIEVSGYTKGQIVDYLAALKQRHQQPNDTARGRMLARAERHGRLDDHGARRVALIHQPGWRDRQRANLVRVQLRLPPFAPIDARSRLRLDVRVRTGGKNRAVRRRPDSRQRAVSPAGRRSPARLSAREERRDDSIAIEPGRTRKPSIGAGGRYCARRSRAERFFHLRPESLAARIERDALLHLVELLDE